MASKDYSCSEWLIVGVRLFKAAIAAETTRLAMRHVGALHHLHSDVTAYGPNL